MLLKFICRPVSVYKYLSPLLRFTSATYSFMACSFSFWQIINGVAIPEALQIAGRKPWEVRHLDTMEMWKFGDYKSYTSLKLLAHILGIPSPKDDIDGSMVNSVYWADKDLDRIAIYCQKDVVTLAQVLLRMHCQPLINPVNVEYKPWTTNEPFTHPAPNGKVV